MENNSLKIISLIIVFVFYNHSVLASPGECINLLIQKTKDPNNIINIRVTSYSPMVHLGNYREIMTSRLSSNLLLNVKKIIVGNYYRVPGEEIFLQAIRVSLGGNFVEMAAPFGERRYFEILNSEKKIKLNEVNFSGTSFPELINRINDKVKTILKEKIKFKKHKEISRNFDYTSIEDLNEFSYLLVESQSHASTTNIMKENLFNANKIMLKILISHGQITIEDIEKMNKEINRGILNKDEQIIAGITRGSGTRVIEEDGQQYRIDVDDLQMTVGNQLLGYLPANLVLKELNHLLNRINTVNKEVSLIEILRYYRDYIVIHPHIDGNACVGRILLDFMALKSGFPPLMHDFHLTRNVIYKTLGELKRYLLPFEVSYR